MVKAHKSITDNDFEDIYKWHKDATLKQRLDIAPHHLNGKIINSNYKEMLNYQIKIIPPLINYESNFIITIIGPATLFYSPYLKTIDQTHLGKGTVYISDYDYGAIHSAPKIKHIGTGRLIISVIPNIKETITEFSNLF